MQKFYLEFIFDKDLNSIESKSSFSIQKKKMKLNKNILAGYLKL